MSAEFPKTETTEDKIAALRAQIEALEATKQAPAEVQAEAPQATPEVVAEIPAVSPDSAQTKQQATELATTEAADLAATQERLGIVPPQVATEGFQTPQQEKIKELTETVDFWSGYARDNINYMNRIYNVQEMEENVRRLGSEAGSPNEKGTLAERYNWIKNRLELYSAMIPAFKDIKKILEEGKLEYPWGGSIEQDIKTWERRGNNS